MHITRQEAWRKNLSPQVSHIKPSTVTFANVGHQKLTITGIVRWSNDVSAYVFYFHSIGRHGAMWEGKDVVIHVDTYRVLSQCIRETCGVAYQHGFYAAHYTETGKIAAVHAVPKITPLI